MAATYPTNINTSLTTKVNFTDVVFAEHVNTLQDEVVAIETTLGNLPAVSSGWVGSFDSTTTTWATVKARINNLEYGLKNVYDKVGGSNILPVANGGTGVSSLGSGIVTFLGTPSSANLASAVTDETGSGSLVFGTSPTITTPTLTLSSTTSTTEGRIAWDGTTDQLIIGDGAATRTISPDNKTATLTNKTIDLSNNTLVATSAQLATAVTDETGSGSLVFGTSPTITPAAGTTTTATSGAGYMGMPQNSQGSSYTLAASDAGKHIYVTTTGQIITIPANGTVAFPIGTTIVIVNGNSVSTSIAITTDTLRLSNSSSTGTRTLASNGMCTLLKINSTEWIASGNGLS